jgi:hypothetical protein
MSACLFFMTAFRCFYLSLPHFLSFVVSIPPSPMTAEERMMFVHTPLHCFECMSF